MQVTGRTGGGSKDAEEKLQACRQGTHVTWRTRLSHERGRVRRDTWGILVKELVNRSEKEKKMKEWKEEKPSAYKKQMSASPRV